MPENHHTRRIDANDRIRVFYRHEKGDVFQFLVKLEHRFGDEWEPIARYDHNPAGGHDIYDEGLHIDVRFADGTEKKLMYPDDFHLSPDAGEVMTHCILSFKANYEKLVELYVGELEPAGFTPASLLRGLWNRR